jgi:putative transposase
MESNPIVSRRPFDLAQGRKSIRLKDYDYSQAGGYYITIVAQGRECLFGIIMEGEMVLNEAGRMVLKWWNELPNKFPSTTLDAFVIMPNHFHGVIFIHETATGKHMGAGEHTGSSLHGTIVGADLRVCPGDMEKGAHAGAPLPNGTMNDELETGEHAGRGEHIGSPLRRPNAPLSQIIQWFKTMTTNEYIRGVKQSGWPPFDGKLWQRNYYEHILRNQSDYERIANYIALNPAQWGEDEENPLAAKP